MSDSKADLPSPRRAVSICGSRCECGRRFDGRHARVWSREDDPTATSLETLPTTPAPLVEEQAKSGRLQRSWSCSGNPPPFSGPAQALGLGMRKGIEAAFHEQNQAGGVHGRMLELVTMDDRYEPGFAFANTRGSDREREGVRTYRGGGYADISRSVVPLVESQAVPFLAPFTGAGFLRDPELGSVVNLRASYAQETEHMIARLTEDLGVTRVAVMYQNDSYGQSGLNGVLDALERRGLEPVVTW